MPPKFVQLQGFTSEKLFGLLTYNEIGYYKEKTNKYSRYGRTVSKSFTVDR